MRTGRDYFTGENLSGVDKTLTMVGAMVPFVLSSRAVREAIGGIGTLVKLGKLTSHLPLGYVLKHRDVLSKLDNAGGKVVKIQQGDTIKEITIPGGWIKNVDDKGTVKYVDPNNNAYNIRLSHGDKNYPDRGPYMRIHTPQGYRDINGNVVDKRASSGHISIHTISD